jgi:hypothetical protein
LCSFYEVSKPHRKEHKKVKQVTQEISRLLRVNQVRIQFTNKPITAWGGLATIVAKLLEVVEFRSWVEATLPIEEKSNNAKGIYEKVLATFLTVLSGGERFSTSPGGAMALRRSKSPLHLTGSPGPQVPSPVFGVKSLPSRYLKNWLERPDNWQSPS